MCRTNDMMYGSWDAESNRQNILSFWTIFCFTSSNNPENQHFEKKYGDIIILHMRTINEDHMMSSSWYMECARQNLLSFWTISCPFTPIVTSKIKILKKMKKNHLEILSFYKCVPWDMERIRQNFFPFWSFYLGILSLRIFCLFECSLKLSKVFTIVWQQLCESVNNVWYDI